MKRAIVAGLVVAALGYAVVGLVHAQTAPSAYPGSSLTCANAVSGDGWNALAVKVGAPSGLALAQQEGGTLSTTIRVGQRVCFGVPAPVVTTTTTVAPTTTLPPTTTVPPVVTTSTTIAPTTSTTTSTTSTTTTTTLAPTTTTAPPVGVQWSEDFATATSVDRFAIEVHNMIGTPNVADGAEGGNNPVTFGGDHDMSCGSPATTRTIHEDHTPATHVWWCAPGNDPAKGHLMTGMNTTGYVVIAMSPQANGQPIVFPATADRICWDQNLTNLGGRKWTQLAVISDDRAAAIDTLVLVNPDNVGNAGNSPVAAADDFVFSGQFNAVFFYKGGQATLANYGSVDISITDKATRYRTCVIDNGNGTVTRTQARPGGQTSTVTGPGSFPAGPRVFILSDDSYNPDKFDVDKPAESPQRFGIADPYTWHWDNITIDGG